MKLFEKKCPNCGANLSFNDNDTSCKCEFCQREFEIERENNSTNNFNLIDIEQQLDSLQKVFNKNPIARSSSIIFKITFLFIFSIAIFIFISIFSTINKQFKYIDKIENISNDTYSSLDNKSSIGINEYQPDIFFSNYKILEDAKRVKFYLLTKEKSNKLIPIYKYVYENKTNNNLYTIYIPVTYNNIKDLFDLDNPTINAPKFYFDNEIYIYGYTNLEEIYEKEIKPLEKEYKIEEK